MTVVVDFDQLPADTQEQLHGLVRTLEAGRAQQVLADLRVLLNRYADFALGHFLLGRALRQLDASEQACAAFERSSQIEPDHPRSHMGLAWARLSQGQFEQAERYAQRVLAAQRGWAGEALAVVAEAALGRGEHARAADGFLQAYQRKPQWPWLQRYCQLVGRAFHSPDEKPPLPWPISPIERLWLYAQIEWRLLQQASKLNPDADEPLVAGCDHSPRWTTGWAKQARLDCVDLYQALIARGGFCDCEVLLNATRQDDEEHAVLIVCGGISHRGAAPEMLAELANEAATALDPEPEGIASHAISTMRIQLPVQAVRGSHLGILIDALAEDPNQPMLSLAVLYPDGGSFGDVVRLAQGRLTVQPVVDRAQLTARALEIRINAATVETMLALLPESGPDEWSMELPLASPEHQGRSSLPPDAPLSLLYSDQGKLFVNTDVLAENPAEQTLLLLDQDAYQPVFHPAGRWACWLRPYRKVCDLILHDRKSGHTKRLLRGKLAGPAFDSQAKRLYVSLRTHDHVQVVAFPLAESGAAEPLPWSAAERIVPAPFGNALALGRGDEWVLVDRHGHQLAPPMTGRSPVWDPTGTRLALLVPTDTEREQAFVLQPDGRLRRLSPHSQECCWLSFTQSGGALVMRCRTARHQTPLDDGRIEVREDERLFRSRVDGTRTDVLLAYDRSYMRIVQPLAHPRANVVAFHTQDEPMQNRRLVVLDPDSRLHTLAEGAAHPIAWL